MHLLKSSFDRITAVLLLTALAGCDSSSQQAVVEETTAEDAAEKVVQAAEIAANTAISRMGNEIFVPEDADAFSPGVQIGERFPDIRAMYDGEEVTNIDRFMKDRGAIFIAVRSVNW